MAKLKTWAEKMEKPAIPEVKMLAHAFADLGENSKMLIPTPRLIESYLKNSRPGQQIDIKQMRRDLAAENGADGTCPLTTGIFLRIVAEFANEQLQKGLHTEKITPVWRAIHPKLPIWNKLSFDKGWMQDLQMAEGLV